MIENILDDDQDMEDMNLGQRAENEEKLLNVRISLPACLAKDLEDALEVFALLAAHLSSNSSAMPCLQHATSRASTWHTSAWQALQPLV